MSYLEGLNDKQKEAVEHIDGPCLVLAGAGSGKTKVLTTRVAYLIDKGINDYNILAITFTNKAANEMKERLNLLVPGFKSFVGTFHSLGLRIIKENYSLLELTNNFSVLDSDDVLSIIKKIMKDKHIDIKDIAPGYIRNRISFIKNEMLNDMDLIKFFNTPPERKALEVYYSYIEILKNNNSVDFDDLLLLPVELFVKHKDILDKYQERYKYILVDEYQDTNEIQYKFCKLLSSKYRNLFVVGDPDQSVYSFRQANYKNILNFERDYDNAKVYMLEENYRSTDYILKTANRVIGNNKERKEKNLWTAKGEGVKAKYLRSYDERHEITLAISEIKELLRSGYNYSDMAFLYRTNAQSRVIEEMLIKDSIPYKIVGSVYFYNRKEIKDLISYLRLIHNCCDELALRRVINVPKRGIGEATIKKLESIALEKGITLFDAIDKGKELEFKLLIKDLTKKSANLSLTETIELVLDESGLIKELESTKTLENSIRVENLKEFISIAVKFEERTGSVNLGDFLEEVSLIADLSEHKEDNNGITLMTIHSAKGLEFEIVFLIGMEEGIFPHANSLNEEGSIEEERRLCYVGITRAKSRLFLSNAKRRLLYGRETVNIPSRFISEIGDDLLDIAHSRMQEERSDTSLLYSADDIEYNKGDIITHNLFGRGVVIDTDRDLITIAFKNEYGVKKFSKNHLSIRRDEE